MSSELRQWAIGILSGTTIEEKLYCPDVLTDCEPGPPHFWDEPSRPTGMGFSKHSRKERLPPLHELDSSENRAVCLHRFAGHELLAVEIMAFALLAYPDAPKHFRRGLANTLKEEQEHVRLYMTRLEGLGVNFGDLPLYRHFWGTTQHLFSPKQYVSVMSLTFEMANLDFAPQYGSIFDEVGDVESSNLMRRIFTDELAHVGFGWHWLKRFSEKGEAQWDAWLASLPATINPKQAMGRTFNREGRREAGVSEEWLESFLVGAEKGRFS